MSASSSSQYSHPTSYNFIDSDIWVVAYAFSLFIILLLMIFQIIGLLYNQAIMSANSSSNCLDTKSEMTHNILICLFGTYITAIIGICTVVRRLYYVSDVTCKYTYELSLVSYATLKCFNYFFFLQRAKIAQGISPIIKDIYFNRILPCILICFWLSEIILIIFLTPNVHRTISPTTGRKICEIRDLENTEWLAIIIQMLIDISLTVFFLYLFGGPLYIVHKTNLKFSYS